MNEQSLPILPNLWWPSCPPCTDLLVVRCWWTQHHWSFKHNYIYLFIAGVAPMPHSISGSERTSWRRQFPSSTIYIPGPQDQTQVIHLGGKFLTCWVLLLVPLFWNTTVNMLWREALTRKLHRELDFCLFIYLWWTHLSFFWYCRGWVQWRSIALHYSETS